ncbi:hypothetical protein ACTHAM_000857 [Cellulomonas soli]|uniref:hypothetical protein n=1 Tax=Cellulomonas soli TaxID=931535 RepID=UPI003F82E177
MAAGTRTNPPDAPSSARDAAPRGLDDLYDIGRLADRLGVEHATIRVWLSRKVPWLPAPDGRLNGGAVWRASTLEGIEERRCKGRPGRKPRIVPPAAASEVPRTGAIPVVRPTLPQPSGEPRLPALPTD